MCHNKEKPHTFTGVQEGDHRIPLAEYTRTVCIMGLILQSKIQLAPLPHFVPHIYTTFCQFLAFLFVCLSLYIQLYCASLP